MCLIETNLGKIYIDWYYENLYAIKLINNEKNVEFCKQKNKKHIAIQEWIIDFCQGQENKKPDIDIDLSKYSEFEKQVLFEVMNIPRGEVMTYREIAVKINRPYSCRAVGNAVGKNFTPLFIPCHRVIRSDGNIGGYNWGIQYKKILLKMERIICK